MDVKLHQGNCLHVMKDFESDSIDSIVTDPPYGLKFMGKKWDYDVPSVEIWKENLRILKPGGTALIFAGSRTQHRMAINVEDAGFILKDVIMWIFGSGFPKSTDISKQIDKNNGQTDTAFKFTKWMRTTGVKASEIDKATQTNMGGHYLTNASQPAVPTKELFEKIKPLINIDIPDFITELIDRIEAEREVIGTYKAAVQSNNCGTSFNSSEADENGRTVAAITTPATPEAQLWEGFGTALKPAYEPIIVAMKPNDGTYANNALKHGVAGLNIDGCLVETEEILTGGKGELWSHIRDKKQISLVPSINKKGRWPANIIHDGSDEVLNLFPETKSGKQREAGKGNGESIFAGANRTGFTIGDSGSAARFFYCAKASKKERGEGNNHPTVKPLALMKYLCKLVYPPNAEAIIMDMYMGSGTTGKACVELGYNFIGIEDVLESFQIAERRINQANTQMGF